MSSPDIIQGIFSCVSSISAAAAAYFAFSAIRENKKNAFIHHRYSLALIVKELYLVFRGIGMALKFRSTPISIKLYWTLNLRF